MAHILARAMPWHTYLLEQCPKKFPEKGYIQITGALYDKAKAQIAKIK